jgi:hypothetical protein
LSEEVMRSCHVVNSNNPDTAVHTPWNPTSYPVSRDGCGVGVLSCCRFDSFISPFGEWWCGALTVYGGTDTLG